MPGFGELARQLVGHDVVGRNAPSIDPLDAMLVGLRQSENVSVQL